MTGKPRLLCVDDEPELLAGIKLNLRKRYAVTTANSGPEALSLFEQNGSSQPPFDVVLSDMRMPQMSGAELLTRLRQRYPNMPRLLLSGQSDLDSAIAAINDAKIFRFLTKPCPPELIIESIDEALEQARLRNAERELLDKTLSGTVTMMTEVLGLVSTGAYSRTLRLKEIVKGLSAAIGRPVPWDLALATMLSQVGFVILPDEGNLGTTLQPRHAELAADLVVKVPRMEPVAALIRHQLDERPACQAAAATDWPRDQLSLEILRTSVHYDGLVAGGLSKEEAHQALKESVGPPPQFLLDALDGVRQKVPDTLVQTAVKVRALEPGMELAADVNLVTGPMLATAGIILNSALIGRIKAFARSTGVEQPILVLVPASSLEKTATP